MDTVIQKDLRLNFRRLVEEGELGPVDSHLALLALATATQDAALAKIATDKLSAENIPVEQIQEARDSAAIMGMLNTYYRFRHFVTHGKPELAELYKAAGLRMTVFSKPLLGKERFEMLAFTLSVLNGCETCVRSHESVLREAGVSSNKIHDLAKLAAVVKGLGGISSGSGEGA